MSLATFYTCLSFYRKARIAYKYLVFLLTVLSLLLRDGGFFDMEKKTLGAEADIEAGNDDDVLV